MTAREFWTAAAVGVLIGGGLMLFVAHWLTATTYGPVHVPGADPTQVVPFVGPR